jgi:hypothetical protein
MKLKLTTAIRDGQYAFLLSWNIIFLFVQKNTNIYYKFFFLSFFFFFFFIVCLRALINPNEKYVYSINQETKQTSKDDRKKKIYFILYHGYLSVWFSFFSCIWSVNTLSRFMNIELL